MNYISTIPDASNATINADNLADVAAPPSPLKLVDPVPANVVMIPVDIVTLRIRWLPLSAM